MSEMESLAGLFSDNSSNNTNNGTKLASGVINGLIVDGAAKDIQQEVQDGIAESQQAMKTILENIESGTSGAADEAQAVEQLWEEEFWDVCSSAKTLGKAVGVELGKGALFRVGTELVLNAVVEQVQSSDDSRVKMIQAINKSIRILQEALNVWAKWQAAHYEYLDSYGTVELVPGVPIAIFERVQTHLISFGEQRDRISQLASTTKQTHDVEDVHALLMANMAYAQAVFDVSTEISRHPALTEAGLPPMQKEIQAAYSTLSEASA